LSGSLIPQIICGVLDLDDVLMLAVGDPLEAGELLVGDPVGALALGRLRIDTAGTEERWAMISSALRPFLVCLGNFFGILLSPLTSTVKRSAESFSRITPLFKG
jgi:hypothetical protein